MFLLCERGLSFVCILGSWDSAVGSTLFFPPGLCCWILFSFLILIKSLSPQREFISILHNWLLILLCNSPLTYATKLTTLLEFHNVKVEEEPWGINKCPHLPNLFSISFCLVIRRTHRIYEARQARVQYTHVHIIQPTVFQECFQSSNCT